MRPFFGIIAAIHLTTPVILRYIDARQAEGAKNASINRELAILKRAYNMARQQHPPNVQFVPHIPKLKENNVRTGFLEIAQHNALASVCRELGGLWMEAIFEVGYTFGWRRREVTRLCVKQVLVTSSTMGYIRLDVGTTKNEGWVRDLHAQVLP